MKSKLCILALTVILTILLLPGCGKEGPAGRDGIDGNANVIYSQWYTPTSWNGSAHDWYFDVTNSAINQDIVEGGVILAYVSLPNDIFPSAVRQLPAYAIGCNWDYLIPEYGKIEFLCDASSMPGTTNHFFRFVLIPSNNSLKSTAGNHYTADELKKMSYIEVCKKFGIPE